MYILFTLVVDVDGATLGSQFEIAPDGSFDAILPRQSGIVIFVASNAGESSAISSDFLSASLESPLEGSLYAMRVLESADSEANVTINLLTTWAFHLAQQRSESEGLPLDADLVESSYRIFRFHHFFSSFFPSGDFLNCSFQSESPSYMA